ncbi:unnamed protein product, partial [Echinostoma caproni]|uniref:Mitochondrial carrier domain-containing protein n=1 Tax=Echinostoma caproni TaxID=27848 RepID=A0A183BB36_9TREM
YTGSRVPIYEFIRREVFHLPPAAHFTVKRKPPGEVNEENSSDTLMTSQNDYEAGERDWRFVLRAASAGMIAGGTAQFLASPTDLMKVRLQTERAWQSEASFGGTPQMAKPPVRTPSYVLFVVFLNQLCISVGSLMQSTSCRRSFL